MSMLSIYHNERPAFEIEVSMATKTSIIKVKQMISKKIFDKIGKQVSIKKIKLYDGKVLLEKNTQVRAMYRNWVEFSKRGHLGFLANMSLNFGIFYTTFFNLFEDDEVSESDEMDYDSENDPISRPIVLNPIPIVSIGQYYGTEKYEHEKQLVDLSWYIAVEPNDLFMYKLIAKLYFVITMEHPELRVMSLRQCENHIASIDGYTQIGKTNILQLGLLFFSVAFSGISILAGKQIY